MQEIISSQFELFQLIDITSPVQRQNTVDAGLCYLGVGSASYDCSDRGPGGEGTV